MNNGMIQIRRTVSEVRGEGVQLGPPKSRAGMRSVSVPGSIMQQLVNHLDEYVDEDPESFVFTGPKGALVRRGNFNKLAQWPKAVANIGMPGLHFHDLRHTGNMLAAAAGGSTRDLMARMGHDSMNAALIYQHATAQADRRIADQLDVHVSECRTTMNCIE